MGRTGSSASGSATIAVISRTSKWLTDEQRVRLVAEAPADLRLYILAGRYTAGRRATLHALRRRDLGLTAMTVTFPMTKNGDAPRSPCIPRCWPH